MTMVMALMMALMMTLVMALMMTLVLVLALALGRTRRLSKSSPSLWPNRGRISELFSHPQGLEAASGP